MLPSQRLRIARDAFLTGVAILLIHSYFAISMFRAVYADRGQAQAEMAWVMFDDIDSPAVPLAREWLGPTRFMRAIFDWGYTLVSSGPNLRALVLVFFAGGLQWFSVGCVLGAFLSSLERVLVGLYSRIFVRSRST